MTTQWLTMKFFYCLKKVEEKSHTLIIHDAKFLRNKNFLARRNASFSFCPINMNKKLLPHQQVLYSERTDPSLGEPPTQVWRAEASKHSHGFLSCIFISVVTRSLPREPVAGIQRVKEQQTSKNTVWWQRLTASRLIALCGGLLPSTTRWASWKCLPWLSSSCSGLAGPCHAPPFAHWWVDHIVLLWQTAEPRWKNAWTAPHHPSPSRAHYRALSSHPDNRLHLPHQKHSLPGRHR